MQVGLPAGEHYWDGFKVIVGNGPSSEKPQEKIPKGSKGRKEQRNKSLKESGYSEGDSNSIGEYEVRMTARHNRMEEFRYYFTMFPVYYVYYNIELNEQHTSHAAIYLRLS
mmetsp:Transcript_18919/g.27281  ORF Transcript_18919/g.27281 Transcript_18919/m.27281 type:complete len:111 (-) Transcript_18919:180-512(-)